jgi:hypothetical protein
MMATKKNNKKLKPLQIYLIGSGLALVSGIVVKPFAPMGHSFFVFVSLAICIYGIYRHFRPAR